MHTSMYVNICISMPIERCVQTDGTNGSYRELPDNRIPSIHSLPHLGASGMTVMSVEPWFFLAYRKVTVCCVRVRQDGKRDTDAQHTPLWRHIQRHTSYLVP